jgi:hypothetical protein
VVARLREIASYLRSTERSWSRRAMRGCARYPASAPAARIAIALDRRRRLGDRVQDLVATRKRIAAQQQAPPRMGSRAQRMPVRMAAGRLHAKQAEAMRWSGRDGTRQARRQPRAGAWLSPEQDDAAREGGMSFASPCVEIGLLELDGAQGSRAPRSDSPAAAGP